MPAQAKRFIDPILGQAFSPSDHQEAREWAQRQRSVPVRTMIEMDHLSYPEVISIWAYGPPSSNPFMPADAIYSVWRNLSGEVVADPMGRRGYSDTSRTFPTLNDALAAITTDIEADIAAWRQSDLG